MDLYEFLWSLSFPVHHLYSVVHWCARFILLITISYLTNVCVMQCCREYCGTLDSKGKTIVPIIKRCPLFRGQLYACSFYSKVVQNALGSSEVNIRNETITHSKESHVNLTLAVVTPSSGHDAIRPGMQSGADTKKVQALPLLLSFW